MSTKLSARITAAMSQPASTTLDCLLTEPKTSANGRKPTHDNEPTADDTPARTSDVIESWRSRVNVMLTATNSEASRIWAAATTIGSCTVMRTTLDAISRPATSAA